MKNSSKNLILSILCNIVTILIGFIAQKLFIKYLGSEYLGLNGLFNNMVSMLGIVELGIGSAIVYNLYKPIVNKDKETIKSLMKFYKKAYNIIAVIVFIVAIIIIPFLPKLINDITVNTNIYLIYMMFIIDIVCSYLLSYKRSILYADQKNYIINIIHMAYLIILNFIQLILLYFTKNYYYYLVIKIIMRIAENIIITLYTNKKYSYLKDKNIKKLDKKIEEDIFKKVKALFFHKVGSFIVLGSDNLIISRFIGIISVGLYSNYFLVINAIQTMFNQGILALTPSVGNMLVNSNYDKNFETFKKIRFLNYWLACFSGVAILLIMDSFITLWLGNKFVLNKLVLVVLVFNYYQKLMRSSYNTFKEAAGIYNEDRFVPLIESIINILFSILLIKPFGLAGVFMGTVISGLSLWCYSYPKFVYKKLFNRKYVDYAKETLGYIILFLVICIVCILISINVNFSNNWYDFFKDILIATTIPNIIMTIIFTKTDNFNYFKKIILNKIKKQ